MRAILIGHGDIAGQWLAQLKTHPRTTLVAIVNGDVDTSSDAAGLPGFASVDAAMKTVQANAALLTAGGDIELAARALSAGLPVIVADTLTRDQSRQLTAAFKPGNGNLYTLRFPQYQSCRKSLQRFVRSRRLGDIGHVSCIDRRRLPAESRGLADQNLQWRRFGASQLAEICDLFESEPHNVMARITSLPRSGSCTEAFLEIRDDINIHYFGLLDTGRDEHTLWIEGTKGSLRTNGRGLWWRKRGWRFFVPVRVGLPKSGSRDMTGLDRVARLVDRPSAASHLHDLPVIELAAAAIESDRTKQAVPLSGDASWMAAQ